LLKTEGGEGIGNARKSTSMSKRKTRSLTQERGGHDDTSIKESGRKRALTKRRVGEGGGRERLGRGTNFFRRGVKGMHPRGHKAYPIRAEGRFLRYKFRNLRHRGERKLRRDKRKKGKKHQWEEAENLGVGRSKKSDWAKGIGLISAEPVENKTMRKCVATPKKERKRAQEPGGDGNFGAVGKVTRSELECLVEYAPKGDPPRMKNKGPFTSRNVTREGGFFSQRPGKGGGPGKLA